MGAWVLAGMKDLVNLAARLLFFRFKLDSPDGELSPDATFHEAFELRLSFPPLPTSELRFSSAEGEVSVPLGPTLPVIDQAAARAACARNVQSGAWGSWASDCSGTLPSLLAG